MEGPASRLKPANLQNELAELAQIEIVTCLGLCKLGLKLLSFVSPQLSRLHEPWGRGCSRRVPAFLVSVLRLPCPSPCL